MSNKSFPLVFKYKHKIPSQPLIFTIDLLYLLYAVVSVYFDYSRAQTPTAQSPSSFAANRQLRPPSITSDFLPPPITWHSVSGYKNSSIPCILSFQSFILFHLFFIARRSAILFLPQAVARWQPAKARSFASANTLPFAPFSHINWSRSPSCDGFIQRCFIWRCRDNSYTGTLSRLWTRCKAQRWVWLMIASSHLHAIFRETDSSISWTRYLSNQTQSFE